MRRMEEARKTPARVQTIQWTELYSPDQALEVKISGMSGRYRVCGVVDLQPEHGDGKEDAANHGRGQAILRAELFSGDDFLLVLMGLPEDVCAANACSQCRA